MIGKHLKSSKHIYINPLVNAGWRANDNSSRPGNPGRTPPVNKPLEHNTPWEHDSTSCTMLLLHWPNMSKPMITHDDIWSNRWPNMIKFHKNRKNEGTKAAAKGAGLVEFHHAKASVFLCGRPSSKRVNTFEQLQCVSWGDCKANKYEAHIKTCYVDLFRTSVFLLLYLIHVRTYEGTSSL